MYILLISRGYPSKKEPQWGCFEVEQAEALQRLGHKVVIASVDRRFRFFWRKIGVEHLIKKEIHVYNSFFVPSAIISLFCSKKKDFKISQYQFKRMYDKIIKEHGMPDVIYSQYLYNTAYSACIDRYGVPLVAIEHFSALNNDILSANLKFLGDLAYKGADEIIAVSKSLSLRIKEHFGRNSVIVNNMVNDSFFSLPKLIEKDSEKFNFITVGSLIPLKNHSLLISAFAQSNFTKNVTLSIIGGGELKVELQKQIDDLGLNDNVFLLGLKHKDEIKEMLYNSDVFVLPSDAETFGVVIIEALSAGLPCIATICGGPEEIITKSNGLLVPVKNLEKLVEAMVYIKDNYSMYNKQDIVKDCKEKYSTEVIAKRLEAIFERIINKNQTSN